MSLTTIKYGPNGNQLWKESQNPGIVDNNVQVEGAALDMSNNLCIVASFFTAGPTYWMCKYSSNGDLDWTTNNVDASCGGDVAHALIMGSSGFFWCFLIGVLKSL